MKMIKNIKKEHMLGFYGTKKKNVASIINDEELNESMAQKLQSN
jgi:hypothetical protein